MSDVFQQGLAQALPLLMEVQKGIKAPPKASKTALKRLRKAATTRPAAAVQPLPPPPATEWTWELLEKAILGCVKCPNLVASRTQVVFGVGNRSAELMFIGEAPGAEEDAQGEPFVGRSGQLITKIIEAMGFTRDDIFIANVMKCRPDMAGEESGNRKPKGQEMATCLPWLREQVRLVKPRAMVALGATAAEGLLGETRLIRDIRGTWLEFESIPVMVTYHPAWLLRNQTITEKRKVWEDMLLVLKKLGRPITPKQERFFTTAAQ